MSVLPAETTTNIPREDQRSLCTAIYYRLAALDTYDLKQLPPLRSSILLLKPSAPTIKTVSADYGLGTVIHFSLHVV